MNENASQLMYILLNDITLYFVSFGGVDILKHIIVGLIIVPAMKEYSEFTSIF